MRKRGKLQVNAVSSALPTNSLRWVDRDGVRTLEQYFIITDRDETGITQRDEWREIPIHFVQKAKDF